MNDKAAQSRINGAKSHGPITDAGKDRVSQNATKHGCYSYRVVIRGESEEMYEKFYLAYWDEYKPETPSEADAVEDIINSRWKIRRLETIESNYYAMANAQYQDHPEYMDCPPDTQQRVCFNHLIEKQPGFEACAKFLERYQRANARAIRNLDRIRKAAGKPKIEVNDAETGCPSNTQPQAPAATDATVERKPPVAIQPDPPKREHGNATLEILLAILLFLSLSIRGCPKRKNEGSVPSGSHHTSQRTPLQPKPPVICFPEQHS